MRNLLWSGFFMALLLSGCGWDGTASRQNDITPLTSITVTADYSTIAPNTSVKLKATGNFSGYYTRDISDQATWTSGSPAVASFATTTNPRVTGQAPGSAVLTATMGGVSAAYTMKVSSATATAVAVTPVAPSVALGVNQQFTATGTFSDASTQDITFDATWTSGDTSVAAVAYSDSVGKEVATPKAVGITTIAATFGGISGSTVLTVTAPVLQSIALTTSDSNTSVLSLSTVTFTATGTYSDSSTKDITSQVTWSSSSTSVAPAPSSAGVTTAAAPGTTSIGATLDGISGTTALTVAGGTLSGFSISPGSMTIVKGTSRSVSATGSFSTGVTRDVTGAVTWSVDNTSIATVTAVSGNRVLIDALATGTTTLRATSSSQTATITLAVTSPGLSSFAVSPTSLSLTAGTSSHLTATAYYNDGTNQDVTANVAMTTNNSAVASVGTAGPSGVLITGVAKGSTSIAATFDGQTLSTPVPVSVSTRNLSSISVSPGGTQSLTSGNQTSFTATATYSDGTTANITSDAAWTTGSGNIAILPDSTYQPGQVIGVGSGSTSLTATFGGLTATVTIKVP